MSRWLLILGVLAACSDGAADPAWMASIADGTPMTALSLPGTHDSGARFEPAAGLAMTQDLTIAEQLAAGVRFFDLRCRHVEDAFLIYHGAIDQNQTFEDVLVTLETFLAAHPSEAILASVKEEATPSNATRAFDATFMTYVAAHASLFSLATSLPTLGALRGRVQLVRRFASEAALGIDASPWADNATFSIPTVGMRVQDEYVVTSNDAKWAAITALLDEAATGDPGTLVLNFTSGYQTVSGLPNITLVSDDINARLDALTTSTRTGVLVMDHVDAARVQAVIDRN